jgi:Leucine-rich repeat (LRR) protein
LVSLELDHFPIMDFPDSPEIWALKNLLKLSLGLLKFPTPKDFENFTNFIKSLDKLTELSLNQLEDESIRESVDIEESEEEDESVVDENRNNIMEILAHLLFLPTLTKLTFKYFSWIETEEIFNLHIQNPSVEELTVQRISERYMKIFPNVRKINLHFVDADLTPINSWTLLEGLEVEGFQEEMLFQIDLKTLRCFKIDVDYNVERASWRHFCLNHPQLERLEVGRYSFENLLVVVENLPNLKTLIFKGVDITDISEEKAIKMIAEKCAKLEYLEAGVEIMKAETAVAVLKEKLPGLRGCVKQINGSYEILDSVEF